MLFRSSIGAQIFSHVVSIGTVSLPDDYKLPPKGSQKIIDEDPVRCFDKKISDKMVAEIESAHKAGDTLGGVVEILVYGLPPGLGSYSQWDRRIDGQLAGALMGIQAIKGVEVGDGFTTAKRRGSVAHDEIEKDSTGKLVRRTDRAGGTEGEIGRAHV